MCWKKKNLQNIVCVYSWNILTNFIFKKYIKLNKFLFFVF